MAFTDWIPAGTVVAEPSVGSDWVNVPNARVQDGSFATCSVVTNSDVLVFSGFGFASLIPESATLDGLEIRVYDRMTGGGSTGRITPSGGNEAIYTPPVLGWHTVGGAGNVLGTELSDIRDAGFNLRLYYNGPSGGNVTIDGLEVKVYYTGPGSPGAPLGRTRRGYRSRKYKR